MLPELFSSQCLHTSIQDGYDQSGRLFRDFDAVWSRLFALVLSNPSTNASNKRW